MSAYLHRCGVHFGLGSGGFSLAICSQRGLVWDASARSSMTWVASSALVCVSVVVAIVRGEGVSGSNRTRSYLSVGTNVRAPEGKCGKTATR